MEVEISRRCSIRTASFDQHELYRQLYDEAPLAQFAVGVDGHIHSCNRAAAQLLGRTVEEFAGRQIIDFYADTPAGKEAARQVLQRFLSGEVISDQELEMERADGSTLWVSLSVRPLHDAHGRLIEGRSMIVDITRRKFAEQACRESEEKYHDLFQSAYDVVFLADERGNILDINRRGEEQVLTPQVLDLNDLVVNVEKLLRRVIGEQIELRAVLTPKLGAVKADPGQLEQVIMNLAVNARDAMPDGGQLTIETENAELDQAYASQHRPTVPGAYVMLSVSDTGTGMDETTKARIFEPFFTTKETGKGTGLGLATVYGIVKQSGGYVWVYSEPGHGTTFKVYLPRVEETAAPLGKPDVVAGSLRGTETVLLAEDEAAVRTVTRQILQRHGYTVLEAADVESALTFTLKHDGPIQLLLTDVVMPGLSGRELGERLTAKRPGMKVLYMSGYTDDAVVRHGLLAPGLGYLQKPFTPDGLARKVRELLDAR